VNTLGYCFCREDVSSTTPVLCSQTLRPGSHVSHFLGRARCGDARHPTRLIHMCAGIRISWSSDIQRGGCAVTTWTHVIATRTETSVYQVNTPGFSQPEIWCRCELARGNDWRVNRALGWHITLGRTPVDEWSAFRRSLSTRHHWTLTRDRSMPLAGFETTILASEWLQTHTQTARPLGWDLLSIHGVRM
jgi:hypothetical protein